MQSNASVVLNVVHISRRLCLCGLTMRVFTWQMYGFWYKTTSHILWFSSI